jgi:hypothetical protein
LSSILRMCFDLTNVFLSTGKHSTHRTLHRSSFRWSNGLSASISKR